MLKYLVVIGDSRNMSEVVTSSVDLVVTSPPYWNLDTFSEVGEPGSRNDLSQIQERGMFFREITNVWKECERVLKPGKFLVCEWEDYPVGSRVYGYPREIFLAGDMVKSIEDVGLYLISRWVWHKFETGVALRKFQYTMYDNLPSSDPRAIANWAYAFAFKKKAWSTGVRELDFTRRDWKTYSDGVWYIEAGSTGAGEVISGGAVFPDELIRRFLKIYTMPGDTVLDPFLGTGTTMKVAFESKRSCIGYEVLPKMLPAIKSKTMFGSRLLTDEEISWEVIE